MRTASELRNSAVPFDGPLETPCMFLPLRPNNYGYVRIVVAGKSVGAHRFLYKELIGPLSDELDLDHLCRQRACVNVFEHLEPVPGVVNILRGEGECAKNARKTHCVRGHAMEGYNLHIRPGGWRQCRQCTNERRRLPQNQEKRRLQYLARMQRDPGWRERRNEYNRELDKRLAAARPEPERGTTE